MAAIVTEICWRSSSGSFAMLAAIRRALRARVFFVQQFANQTRFSLVLPYKIMLVFAICRMFAMLD